MDALKSAGRAILSPNLARNRVTGHQKLPESWTDVGDNLLEGIVFHLKYLGMTLVEKPKGEDMASAAIRRIITMARVSAKKFQKVVITVTPHGISLQDAATRHLIENVSIYRISYCTTDKVQNKVFAYVAQNQTNGALECHAFLSPKKKLAQAVTLTVAQAFKVALDLWESGQEGKEHSSPRRDTLRTQGADTSGTQAGSDLACDRQTDKPFASTESVDLLQLGVSSGHLPQPRPSREQKEEEDDDDEFDDLDEAFSRLAKSISQDACSTGTLKVDCAVYMERVLLSFMCK